MNKKNYEETHASILKTFNFFLIPSLNMRLTPKHIKYMG